MKLERLIELRKEKNLSQDDIEKYLCIPKRQYSRIECGISNLSIELLIKLARFYDTSTDYILGITDVKEQYPTSEKITN